MVLFESCRYEAMKQCRLSYRTSQSDLSVYTHSVMVILAAVMLVLIFVAG